jgi:hypothetical protein
MLENRERILARELNTKKGTLIEQSKTYTVQIKMGRHTLWAHFFIYPLPLIRHFLIIIYCFYDCLSTWLAAPQLLTLVAVDFASGGVSLCGLRGIKHTRKLLL